MVAQSPGGNECIGAEKIRLAMDKAHSKMFAT